jgi:DNA-binding GntR family transcriptional regulator
MTEQIIVRRDLNDQVYDAIKDRLLERSLGPGAKLSLQTLADELGVSRSPVHHALTRLVEEGLVSTGSRGYFVRPLTVRLMDDAYDVRLALELYAAEQTVGRLSPAQLAGFRNLLALTIAPVQDRVIVDVKAYMLANKEFHEYQVDLAGNELMSDIYRRLSVHRLMERVFLSQRTTAAGGSTEEHSRIVEAFEAGELEEAKAALRANVDTGKLLVRAAIEEAGGEL